MTERWNSSRSPKGFGFKHWFAPEGWNAGRDPQLEEVLSKSDPATARIYSTVAEETVMLLTDQDGCTLGPLRFAAGTLAEFLSEVARDPRAAAAFGPANAALMQNEGWVKQNNPDQDDGDGLTRFEWFRKGIYQLLREPWFLERYHQYYDEHLIDDAERAFKSLGWQSERGFALLVRIRNSGSGRLSTAVKAAKAKSDESEEAQVQAAAQSYADAKDLYARRVASLYKKHGTNPITKPVRFGQMPWGASTPRPQQLGAKSESFGSSADQEQPGEMESLAEPAPPINTIWFLILGIPLVWILWKIAKK